MKARFLIFLALAGIARAADPETFDPPVATVERYQHIWEKSPFVAEVVPVQNSTTGLAQRFVLTGMATLHNEPLVFVLDRQSLTRLVVSKESKAPGPELVSVESNSDPKRSTATIRLGSEQGVIRYDLAALQSVNQAPEKTEAQNSSSPATSAPNAPAGASPTPPRGARIIKKSISVKQP